MEEENITLESLDGAFDIDASSDYGAVETVPQDTVETLSLEELNKYLGKNYKDKATALKSVKDTFSYVGKKVEVKKDVDLSGYISKDQYETDMFYSKNPEYESSSVRAVIDSMAKAEGKKPAEIVQSENFKTIFGKVKGYDESQSVKSVLESNPRLASSRDKMSQAGEAMRAGNKLSAEELATRAVMEAYE